MFETISDYFFNLNNVGQALFVVGVLLVITFIILLIVVLKPQKNKVKKVYGESAAIDKENAFERKLKDINNITDSDINIENDRTRNLKSIVDQLKELEAKNKGHMDEIKKYEAEQEDTAVISIEELIKKTAPKEEVEVLDLEEPIKETYNIERLQEVKYEEPKTVEEPSKENTYTPRQEVFSPIFGNSAVPDIKTQKEQKNNEEFLNSLKEFRNNL